MPHVPAVPIVVDGEDEASYERHVKLLSLEYKKAKPNKHSVTELMKRTFSFRRRRILAGDLSMEIGPRHMLVEVILKSVRVNLYFCHEVALTLVRDTLIFA